MELKDTKWKRAVSTSPVFREARAVIKRQYLFRMSALESLARDEAINLPWLMPEYFRKSREEIKGLSQEQLARVSGVSRASLAKFESGASTPTLDTAEKIYTALEELGSASAGRALIDLGYTSRLTAVKISEAEEQEIQALSKHRESLITSCSQIQQKEDWLQERIVQRGVARIETQNGSLT